MKKYILFCLLFPIGFLTSCSSFSFTPFGNSNYSNFKYSRTDIERARYTLNKKTGRDIALPQVRTFLSSNALIPKVEKLPSFDLYVNGEVRKKIVHYRKKDSLFVKLGLKRKALYFPMLEEVFRDEGLPAELLSVAHVESIFDSEAKNSSGATGLWQFMPATAKHYGLDVGFFKDQRKSAVYSSIAAARYLKDLYKSFKDWKLALAAYNAGPGRVRKAIRKANSRDFWVIAQKKLLSNQTIDYVPKVMALALIEKNPKKFGFNL